MPIYHTLGQTPRKRHTVFRQESGELFSEHLMGSVGFSGPSSLLYHIHRPTAVLKTRMVRELKLAADPNSALRMRHFHLAELTKAGSPTLGRTPLLFNADVTLSIAGMKAPLSKDGSRPIPSAEIEGTWFDDAFYRNGQADEIVYVSDGQGVLQCVTNHLTLNAYWQAV